MTELRADYLTRFRPIGEEAFADKSISVFRPKDLDRASAPTSKSATVADLDQK